MLLIVPILLLISTFIFPATSHAVQETGGTDYSAYYLGEYATNPTDGNWPQVRAVLTHYHENPSMVKDQLQAMCDHGQKKIGFALWFYPYAPAGAVAADSSTWQPSDQLKQNIKDVIGLVKTQRDSTNNSCFNEVQFRFANIGSASPEHWNEWKENTYQQNKSFIYDVRKVVKDAVNGSSLALYFDLAMEHGGSGGLSAQYVKKFWEEYTDNFGSSDTYGFSIAWYPGRLTKLNSIYQDVGVSPSEYAIDFYKTDLVGPIESQLQEVLSELKQIGQSAKSILIQETFFNDPIVYQAVQNVEAQGLKVRSIMQWQLPREGFYIGRRYSTTAPYYMYFETGSPPIGGHTNTTCQNITGWACDPDDYSQELKIAFYSDPDFHNLIGNTTASLDNPAITDCGNTNNHSFVLDTPNSLKNGKEHTIYAYAINIEGGTYNPLLTNSPHTITCNPTNPPSLPGDFNQDGKVNIFDYNILVAGYGTEYDTFNYNELVNNYGK